MFSRPFLSLFAPKITAKHLAVRRKHSGRVSFLTLSCEWRTNCPRTARSEFAVAHTLPTRKWRGQPMQNPSDSFQKIAPILNKKIFKIK